MEMNRKSLYPLISALLVLFLVSLARPQTQTCGGISNDTAIHPPQPYSCGAPPCSSNPFPPPPDVNQSLIDPQYGCTITRLTKFEELGPGESAKHNYSTQTPFNADSSMLLVRNDAGEWAVVDRQGRMIVSKESFPNNILNGSDVVWDVHNPLVFYITGNATGDPSQPQNQWIQVVIENSQPGSGFVAYGAKHTFTGFSNVTIPDQTDLSDDGCKIWLEADNGSGGTAVSYNLCTDTVNSQSLNIGAKDDSQSPSWHKIQTFPSGKMLMTWNNAPGAQGPEVIFNTDGTLYWDPLFSGSSHADVGTDLQQHEVLVSSANGVAGLSACSDSSGAIDPWGGINAIDINAKAAVNCVIGSFPSWHVSYRDSPGGWVLLTTFDQTDNTDPSNPNLESCLPPSPSNHNMPGYSCFDTTTPSDLAADWQSRWKAYYEEVVLAKIDGSAVYRLAHHRSRSGEYYWAAPRGAISRDGKYIVFDSNYDISNTGQPQYTDVYLIQNPTQ